MKSTDLISVFCRPVPFWSWNDKLEPDELRRQIGAMQDAGMGGFFMHARGGLETEYLSEDWFRAVEASVDEAKKRGMQAWCYDENGWPSGFAGGKLLENPENWAHYLRFERKRTLMQPRLAFTRWKTVIFAASPARRTAFQSISASTTARIPPRSISLTRASRMRFLL